MRWEESGTGFPVVFIHGIPTSPALWRHVVPRIGDARCLAWKMVGYGASIPQGEGRDISVSRQAEYLVDWLKEMEIERAIFAGHDLGGGVAQIAAVRHPKLCAGLFLTNAIGYDSWPIPSVKAMRTGQALVRRMPDAAMRLTMAALFRRGHDDAEQAGAALKEHWPHYRTNGAGEAMARQVAALDVNDTLEVADALSQLDIPARIVWGAADRFQKIKYGEWFARDLNATLVRVEGGKHFMPEDHPEAVAAAINDLLEEVRQRKAGASGSKQDGENSLAAARAALASLPEVMPVEANPKVQGIYQDIQNVLRVPFVNFLFRVMASDPDYLERAWTHLRPIAGTRAFEDAASELRVLVRSSVMPDAVKDDWRELGDIDRVRAFTESIDYVLPKLLLIAMLLDKTTGSDRWVAGSPIPMGVADGTEKIPMVDPEIADEELRRLFDDIRDRHQHPKVATYFRSLGQWPALLKRVWQGMRPHVGDKAYVKARADLIGKAERLMKEAPRADLAAPSEISRALEFFHQRLIPDLMLDMEMVRAMLSDTGSRSRNQFDVGSRG
ncbi:alpha/beta fold hydrolase [uncultured Jannaschia sp.]|uniref:alpha/beta fold hydrolase n=1 Tax=uncultured Jannaschia sp. TaxID=293347 RepID=UPI00262F3D38|nr:alpha/beta fold hydrolase [uncultured Jannaschia sp.]